MKSEILDGILLFFLFPEWEIFFEQFDDWFGISESFLVNIINLLEGILKSLFSKFTGLLVLVHDFVVEHWEVKSKTKSDWVASIEWSRWIMSKFVMFKSASFDFFELIFWCTFSNISVVVTDHLIEESFGFISLCNSHAWWLDGVYNTHAFIVELTFDFFLINCETIIELLILWVLFNSTDGSNGCSLWSNLIFESHWK